MGASSDGYDDDDPVLKGWLFKAVDSARKGLFEGG